MTNDAAHMVGGEDWRGLYARGYYAVTTSK